MASTNADFLVRGILVEDKPRWLSLWAGYLASLDASGLDKRITENTWKRLITPEQQDMHCLVAVRKADNLVVGFSTYVITLNTWSINPGMYLEDLFVDSCVRKKGVGSLLINSLKQMCKEKQYSRLFWLTGGDNYNAQSLYNKLAKETKEKMYKIVFTDGTKTAENSEVKGAEGAVFSDES